MGLTDIIQILLIREFIINFQGNELSLGVILANWVLLMALGSWQLGKLADRLTRKVNVFIITQVLVAVILPLEILFARSISSLVDIEHGASVGLLPIFYCSLAVLAPLGILRGFQFALGSRILSTGSQRPAVGIGKVYICEAIGTMIGGILFTYLLVHHFYPLEIALGVGLLCFFSVLLLLKPETITWGFKKEWIAKLLVCLIVLSLVVGIYSLVGGDIDTLRDISAKWQWEGHDLVSYQNSVYGNVSVTRTGEQLNFYESGLPMLSVPDPDVAFNEEVIHFPMLYHPSPKQILLIGGGIGGTLEQVLDHPVDEVHYAELDPLIIKVTQEYAPKSFLDTLNDARVSIKHVDGRLFVKNAHKTYDVVIVTLPSPSTLQLNRLYTKEFFIEVSNVLKTGGIFATTVSSSETYISKEMANQNRCLNETLREVYDNVLIIPGDYNIFLASSGEQRIEYEVDTICRRFQNRGLETKLLTADYIRYKLDPVRIEPLLSPIFSANRVTINRDLQPRGCFFNLAIWNAMFYPGATKFFGWISRMQLWWFVIPSVLLILVGLVIRLRRKASVPRKLPIVTAIITSGFAGMTLSIILLLTLQTLQGYLYQMIALITAAFMLGLALGGAYMNRMLYRLRREVLTLAKIELIIVAYSLFLALIIVLVSTRIPKLPTFLPVEIILSVLNCAAGFLVGLEFPLANKIYLTNNERVGQVAGSLYAADLVGGFIGAVATSVFLVPLLGVPQTCFVIAMLNGASFIFLLTLVITRKQAV